MEIDAAKSTVKFSSEKSHDWILRAQVLKAPTFVNGSDEWSYDAANHVIIVYKDGKDFQNSTDGLRGKK